MKIVIENTVFPFDKGCRLLKLKHETSPFEQLNEMWDDIKPMTFKEIAQLENLEERRVGILCLGLERLVEEINPVLIDSQTIQKQTTYINAKGELVTEKFGDTYELYKVEGKNFGQGRWGNVMEDSYFVKFKDTSTDRKYMIWVDTRSVYETNQKKKGGFYTSDQIKVNAIQAIAWTMQTNVKEGNIEEIIRQGDCVLIKPKDKTLSLLETPRHLTEEEYRTLLVAES